MRKFQKNLIDEATSQLWTLKAGVQSLEHAHAQLLQIKGRKWVDISDAIVERGKWYLIRRKHGRRPELPGLHWWAHRRGWMYGGIGAKLETSTSTKAYVEVWQ